MRPTIFPVNSQTNRHKLSTYARDVVGPMVDQALQNMITDGVSPLRNRTLEEASVPEDLKRVRPTLALMPHSMRAARACPGERRLGHG